MDVLRELCVVHSIPASVHINLSWLYKNVIHTVLLTVAVAVLVPLSFTCCHPNTSTDCVSHKMPIQRSNGSHEVLYCVLLWLADDVSGNRGSQLHDLYDVRTDVVRFLLDECGTDYFEWWAWAIDDYLGPLRCCQEVHGRPGVSLEAHCYRTERNRYYNGDYSDYFRPRDFEWMLYAVEGFERDEVELHLMSPYNTGWGPNDDIEWMFYVDFALSLCRDVVFEYRYGDEWCIYDGLF